MKLNLNPKKLIKKEAIKGIMGMIIRAVGLPLTGAWGFAIKWIIRPLVTKFYNWSSKMVDVFGGREIDRKIGGKQSQRVIHANRTARDINSSFNNLD